MSSQSWSFEPDETFTVHTTKADNLMKYWTLETVPFYQTGQSKNKRFRARKRESGCPLCSIKVVNIEDGKGIFDDLAVSDDAIPSKMIDRKWAMIEGRFKILTKDEARDLEEIEQFKEEAVKGRPIGPVSYSEKPDGYTEEELLSSSKPCIREKKTRYANIIAHHSGINNRHHVVWTNRSGRIYIDRGVKLYSISSVKCHQIEVDCRGPKSPWFALVDPAVSMTCDGKIHFDANLFWTTALLSKNFNTTGIESWDNQIKDLKDQMMSPRSSACLDQKTTSCSTFLKSLVFANLPPERPYFVLPSEQIKSLKPPSDFYAQEQFNYQEKYSCSNRCLKLISQDLSPQKYTGSISFWKRDYGFVTCDHIPGPVFLHSNDLSNWKDQIAIPLGMSVSFYVEYDATKGYKARNASLF